MKEIWSKGDNYGPNNSDIWTAGIHVKTSNGDMHYNAIECYGKSIFEAELRRDLILLALANFNSVEVSS